jgi:hypothetical protein
MSTPPSSISARAEQARARVHQRQVPERPGDGVGEPGQQVPGRCGDLAGGQAAQVVLEHRECRPGPVRRRGAVDQYLAAALQEGTILRGDAEQLADHQRRHRLGERADQVGRLRPGQ